MINLAGCVNCDKFINSELAGAGIAVEHITEAHCSEVPYTLTGKLGKYTFRRAWYYWVVRGDVPLAVAQELYANEIGKKDVRVVGHCGRPPPEDWLGGYHIQHDWPERPNSIPFYHIDSQAGLELFTAMLRKHGLVGEVEQPGLEPEAGA